MERLKVSEPDAAQRAQDWIAWRQGPNAESTYAHAHALGLHRDPSRAATHILLQLVEHTPAARDPRNKFRVKQAGVFRVADVVAGIEAAMGLDKGEGPGFVREAYEETRAAAVGVEGLMPMLSLSFGEGVETWLGTGESSVRLVRCPWLIRT